MDSIGIMSLSGGEAAIFADACSAAGVELGELTEETKSRIRELLPDFASVNNPLDMTSSLVRNLESYRSSVRCLISDENIGLVAMGHNPDEKIPEDERIVDFGFAHCLAEINREVEKPIVILSGFFRKRDMELREFYASNHIAMLEEPKYGLSALKRYMEHSKYDPSKRSLTPACTRSASPGVKTTVLSEHESKLLLREHGITVPGEIVVAEPSQVSPAADKLGYPLVMKIDSPDVPHKTEAGGVRLGISCREEAERAFAEIIDNVRRYKPDARINGVLMQQMLPKGTEMILGITRDPQLGPMLLVGLGGVFTELFKDCALYPAPLGYDEAMEMISSLKAYPILSGYRGAGPLNVDALAKMMVQLGRLAVEREDIKELDINPVFVYENGVSAADALIVMEK